MKKRFWSEREIATVRAMYPDTRTELVAAKLGRTVSQVYQEAARLGLNKSAAYLAGPDACRLRRGDHIGAASRFLRGHVPANKGLRRPGYAPGRMAETQFKRGARQGAAAKNWRPVGTILVDPDGYQRIKLRESRRGEAFGFGNREIWPQLHRHVWEREHGPVPKGHAVCFKDGNRANCELSNLELVSRADLARRNSMWNKMPRELAEVLQLNGALKRKLRRLGEKQAGRSEESSVRDARTA